jgi:hypothetical protein
MNEHAERLLKALQHALELLHHEPHLTKLQAAERTALQFDLGPLDEDWLLKHLTEAKRPE